MDNRFIPGTPEFDKDFHYQVLGNLARFVEGDIKDLYPNESAIMGVWVVETFEKEKWLPVLTYGDNQSGVWRTKRFALDAMREMRLQQPTKQYRVSKYVRKGG